MFNLLGTIIDQKLPMFTRKLFYSSLMLAVIAALLSWKDISSLGDNYTKELPLNQADPIVISSSELIKSQIVTAFEETKLEESGLSLDVFSKAYVGYLNLKAEEKVDKKASVLSIADFSISSKSKRLWIIDLEENKLLLNTWVSHGRGSGSGSDMATSFSNTVNSHQSSLGFYVTGEVYYGKHGRSLRLDGMDEGFNSRARERAIVIHGATYVSSQAIKNLNRLGLSHGCPAVPLELSSKIIDLVKNKTVLYVHANQPSYTSRFLNESVAGETLQAAFFEKGKQSNFQQL